VGWRRLIHVQILPGPFHRTNASVGDGMQQPAHPVLHRTELSVVRLVADRLRYFFARSITAEQTIQIRALSAVNELLMSIMALI
jgi:hypothetical protein